VTQQPLYAEVLLSFYRDLGIAAPERRDPASLIGPLLRLLESDDQAIRPVVEHRIERKKDSLHPEPQPIVLNKDELDTLLESLKNSVRQVESAPDTPQKNRRETLNRLHALQGKLRKLR
jgi:hypothetical protein